MYVVKTKWRIRKKGEKKEKRKHIFRTNIVVTQAKEGNLQTFLLSAGTVGRRSSFSERADCEAEHEGAYVLAYKKQKAHQYSKRDLTKLTYRKAKV